jgi:hypothetical protein
MRVSKATAKKLGLPASGTKSRRKAKETSKLFLAACREHGLPDPIFEYPFAWKAMGRKWRFDWLWGKVALEIQGGIWTQGRHVRGAALLDEHKKLNAAAILGFRVLFCTPKDVESGAIFPVIKKALEAQC